MTDREFFIYTLGDEAPRFDGVFKALPIDKLDYKPDPKSRSAAELAATFSNEAGTFVTFMTTGAIDVAQMAGGPSDIPGIADSFAKSIQATVAKAQSMTEEDWETECKMTMGDKELWKTTKGKMAWGLLFDLIHHRGQLATYIRPMGGKVPAIYGPSADSSN